MDWGNLTWWWCMTYFGCLAIDEDNQSELTDERIKIWVAQIDREFG